MFLPPKSSMASGVFNKNLGTTYFWRYNVRRYLGISDMLGGTWEFGEKTIKKRWYNNDNKFNSNRHSLNPISTDHMFHVLSGWTPRLSATSNIEQINGLWWANQKTPLKPGELVTDLVGVESKSSEGLWECSYIYWEYLGNWRKIFGNVWWHFGISSIVEDFWG